MTPTDTKVTLSTVFLRHQVSQFSIGFSPTAGPVLLILRGGCMQQTGTFGCTFQKKQQILMVTATKGGLGALVYFLPHPSSKPKSEMTAQRKSDKCLLKQSLRTVRVLKVVQFCHPFPFRDGHSCVSCKLTSAEKCSSLTTANIIYCPRVTTPNYYVNRRTKDAQNICFVDLLISSSWSVL